jgi:dTDP-4-amino-4,6-dideoxygalactose transaminase
MHNIRLVKPYISFSEVENSFKEVFETGIFTKGVYVKQLVSELKTLTGAAHAFLTTSATTALTLSLKVLNIVPGDEVIVSDFSFPATVNVVEDIGAKPVFADVSLKTFNMTPEQLESKITKKTKAVIFVDALGNPSGIHKIKEICETHSIPLIEDAACAIGSAEFGKKCGNIADLTCFSFHPRKLLTCGEGGAVTTNNVDLATILERKLNHGANGVIGNKLDFVDYGYNYRLPELQAIMLISQIKKLDDIILERNNIREQYVERLAELEFIPQQINEKVIYNCQSIVFRVPNTVNRDVLIDYLRSNSIESTIGTYCLSDSTYYKNKYDDVQENSYKLECNTITLPCYSGINVDYICNMIKHNCLCG